MTATTEQREIVATVREWVEDATCTRSRPSYEHADEFPTPLVEEMKRARALRRHDPRGVRRARPRSPHLRADPDRALARLDVALGRPQHALHLRLDDRDARHRRAARPLPAADGDGRAAVRVLDDRAARGLGRPGRSAPAPCARATSSRSPARRCGRRTACGRARSCSSRSPIPARSPRHHGMTAFIVEKEPEVEEQPGLRIPGQAGQARLQGRRDDRARSSTASAPRRRSVLGGEGGDRAGLLPVHGRHRARPRQHRRPRRRDRDARASRRRSATRSSARRSASRSRSTRPCS